MLIYVLLIVLSLLFDFISQHKKLDNKTHNILFWGLCIVFTLVSAFRFNIGTDYKGTYTHAYRWLSNGFFYDFEFLFLKLNYLFIDLKLSVVHLMSFCSIITIPSFFVFIKNNVEKKYHFFSIFLLLGTTVYYASMNVVRQYLAIAIFLYSFNFFKEKKYIKYVLANIVASFFHQSILFNIVLFFIFFIFKYIIRKRSVVLIWFIYVVSLIGLFVDFRDLINTVAFFIPDRYFVYLNTVFINEKNMSAFLKVIVPNILLLCCLKYRNNFSDDNVKCYSFYALFVYVLISNMFFGVNVFIRLTWFVDLFLIILIPYILSIFNDNKIYFSKSSPKKFSSILKFLFIVYFIFLNVYSIFINGGHGVVPYHSIFK